MKKVLLIFLFGFFAMSCSDDEEMPPCDTTTILTDMETKFANLAMIDPSEKCEEFKSVGQDAIDFQTANEACVNSALDRLFEDDAEQKAEYKRVIEERKDAINKALALPCL